MFKIPLPELKEKLVSSGKIGAADLENRIKEKINELSGLISEEGAAHIIANELGVELIKQSAQLKIKEIYAGMKGVSTVGKVIRKFDVNEFSKGDRKGKVCSIILGDETGTIRVVFWNNQVDLLKEVEEDTILQVKEAFVKENRDNREIHLGDRGEIVVNPEGISIEAVRQTSSFQRKKINELVDGLENAEILGTIVQVFDPRFFYVHPETGKRLQAGEEGVLSYVMNAILDDGSGTIRGVFWKNQTNNLIGKSEEDMTQFKDNLAAFEEVKTDLLGEQLKIRGRVKRNDMFDRLEFNAQFVEKANPEEEIARLANKQS